MDAIMQTLAHDNENSIQTLIAKIVTNPKYVIKALHSPNRFIKTLNLSNVLSTQLLEFLNNYGSQFLAASFVLKKKRYDAIIEALPLISQIYAPEQLEAFWDRYLTRIDLNQIVSKNPIVESINFCN